MTPPAARRAAARAAVLAVVLTLAVVLGPARGLSAARAQSGGAPQVGAPSAILVQPATGDVVFRRAAGERRQIASTTKLMTAIVARERLGLDDVVRTMPYAAAPAESVLGQRAGERFTVRDQLRALLLVSANDAAATLAVRAAGSRARFVALMNAKARELGLRDTRFANPVGLDDEDNYSTASDLAKLALIARRDPFLRETMNRPDATLRSGARERQIVNRNALVREEPFVSGVKTGHTDAAGYLLIGSGSRGGVEVVSVVMAEPSEAARDRDSLALMRYGLRRYARRTPVRAGQVLAQASLRYRDERVDLAAEGTLREVARRSERLEVGVVDAPAELEGPLPRGAQVGVVEVRRRGEVVARTPLVTARAVDAATAVQRLAEFAARPLTLGLIAAFVLASLMLVALRHRAGRQGAGRLRDVGARGGRP